MVSSAAAVFIGFRAASWCKTAWSAADLEGTAALVSGGVGERRDGGGKG
jgi:hypothetical protein